MKGVRVDLALLNGRIYTMDDRDSVVEAVAVAGDRIVAVGSSAEIEKLCSENTTKIDLGGRVATPGLIDTHTHTGIDALIHTSWVNCYELDSIEEIKHEIRKIAERIGRDRWIMGIGYSGDKLKERRPLDRYDLDEAAPENYVAILSTGAHELAVNTKVLELANITRETPDPPGGKIIRDERGEPVGRLVEAARFLVKDLIPKPDLNELKEGIIKAQEKLARWGITGYDEALVTREVFRAYQELRKEGRLLLRVGLMLAANFVEEPIAEYAVNAGIETGFGDEWLRVVGVKIVADGSLGGLTAAVSEPYKKTGSRGLMLFDEEALYKMVERYYEAGHRVCIHAIGARRITALLDIIEKLYRRYGEGVKERRFRIEHCSLTPREAIGRIKELGIVISSSINFLYHHGDSFLEKVEWEKMINYCPLRSYLKAGIVFAPHSDWYVTPANPMHGIYAAVTRKTKKGQRVNPDERITVYEAVKSYTKNAAYLDFQERERGTIEPGKLADITVFEENIFEVEGERIKDVEVFMTIVGGRIVYRRE